MKRFDLGGYCHSGCGSDLHLRLCNHVSRCRHAHGLLGVLVIVVSAGAVVGLFNIVLGRGHDDWTSGLSG